MVYDFAVFGGGVVGCAILNKLTRCKQTVVLLEKSLDVATGQSKANSGLVHAGFDAKENSLKSKFNVRGNKLFNKLCKELKVDLKESGAIVVSEDFETVKRLYERGKYNGVNGLKLLTGNEIFEKVPNLKKHFHYALYAKTAKLVSPYLFTIALAEEAVINGAKVIFDFETIKIEKRNGVFYIYNFNQIIMAKKIINCAGYGVNEISKLLHVEQFNLEFRRGEYFVLDKTASDFVSISVFPTPSKFGKGILATPTIDGNILFGPNNELCEYGTQTTHLGLNEVKQAINKMYDNVPWNKVIRNYSGVRVSCGDDFVVKLSEVDNDVALIAGINSPGLSSSPAIAEFICQLFNIDIEEKQMKKREDYSSIKKLTIKERNKLIETNPSFGKIVCKCEEVSEGEILRAINSPLKPITFDSIKRRVRTGMGRCQAGFCMMKVVSLLAKEQGLKLEDIFKEEKNSNIVLKDFEYDV